MNDFADAKNVIKKAFASTNWGHLLPPEIKKKIHFVIDHIETLGVPFRNAFLATYRYNIEVRKSLGISKSKEEISLIFGAKLTEESYQSAKNPVSACLFLGDWVQPTEADVQACFLLCDHIEILISYGMLNNEPQNDLKSLIDQFKLPE